MNDERRIYYDHEPAWRRIAQSGGRGWDDLDGAQGETDSYIALEVFLKSEAFASLPTPTRALDLGCGGGQGTIRLAQCGCCAHGVDFSESAVTLARVNAAIAGVDATFTVGDALTLCDFGAKQFDLVIDNHTLHCIIEEDDRRAVLGAIHRVLRPGGLLFSETMSAEGELDMTALEIDPETKRNANRTRFWTTQEEWSDLLERSGFSILSQSCRKQFETPAPGETIVTVASRL